MLFTLLPQLKDFTMAMHGQSKQQDPARAWTLAFGRALGLGPGPRPPLPGIQQEAACAQARAQGPPKGQGHGCGPDPDDLVVYEDYAIPFVSNNPKLIFAN